VRLLDRYVIRNFLQVYLYCIAGFLSIWLIFDVSDNISTFIDEHFGFMLTVRYYATQIPEVLVVYVLPVALMLALLFSLGRMSRVNEIVSMLTAGISVRRVLAPLIGLGLFTAVGSLILNFSLAPHAELAKKNFIATARSHQNSVQGQIFRNRTDLRTWFIQSFRPGHDLFNDVQILQQDTHNNIVINYLAARATHDSTTKSWQLEEAKVVHYDEHGNITDEKFYPSLKIDHWSETPFRLGSANARPEFLSVPELREYLNFNSDFPATLLAPFRTHLQYRIAWPLGCLVVVFLAGPLGIGFSRRGVLGSVAAAIMFVFLQEYLFTHLFLALGEGDRISPIVAGWTPNVVFAVVGGYLLYLRSSNREVPRFHLGAVRRIFAR
jgi:lipopolysaccharide export system permease protein